MDSRLSIRIPDELAQVLAERKERLSMNVSAFVCRAIRNELARPVLDAEPEERRSTSAPAVLFTPRKQAD
jgi:post-segregation antitoxin (ccd killing protein)